MVALVPTLIAPLVILVSYLIQPNLKGLAEDELGSKSSKLSVLMEVLNGHETIRTVSGGWLFERQMARFCFKTK